MLQKRLTHLALMHVHENILDSLELGSQMMSIIDANPGGPHLELCNGGKPIFFLMLCSVVQGYFCTTNV